MLDWRVEKQTCGRKVWFPDVHFPLDDSGARGAVWQEVALIIITVIMLVEMLNHCADPDWPCTEAVTVFMSIWPLFSSYSQFLKRLPCKIILIPSISRHHVCANCSMCCSCWAVPSPLLLVHLCFRRLECVKKLETEVLALQHDSVLSVWR